MGRVAALHDTSASRPFIATEVLDKSAGKERFRWGIGMLPQKDPARPLTATFGASVVAFKSTPLRQAATWEWLRFFAAREETAEWSIATGYLPVRRSAAEHAGLKAQWQHTPQAEQAFRMAEFARPEPNIAAWQGVRDLLQGALAAVIAQRSAPKAALDDAARRANQLIQEKK
jgi:ABC-type glycerol-3-phosphate transport system substrate-binding protein